ncbi:hypothetical protein VOI54_17000 [Tamlana sp. 2201CG12-4]|uniref:hypothetical protein n=1 Tax=Tamlana sp. 2201CG12-4 TaxID=3112582 RepID=UPI002DBD9B63|nr:hypothetical protein [Tamlana sp. 2201CG12-4]MEC3908728.1 hypothetical protein [Tamlana sp. 2201CG12-4]
MRKKEHVIDPVLIWGLDTDESGFSLLSSNLRVLEDINLDYNNFVSLIKPCFKNYFLKIFKNFEIFLNSSFVKKNRSDYCMKVVLPIQLRHDYFSYALLKVIPNTTNKGGVYFVLTPIKEYDNEVINVNVYRNFKKYDKATEFVKSHVLINQMLTKMQENVLVYLLRDKKYTVKTIALCMDKTEASINRCIAGLNDRLNHFFGIQFNNIDDAVIYYKKCFC